MSLQIKGTTFRQGRPAVAVSLIGVTAEEIAAQCREAVSEQAEVIEWRADYYLAAQDDLNTRLGDSEVYLEMLTILDEIEHIAGDRPVIFTLRGRGQGGMCDLDDAQTEALQIFAADSGLVDLVDVEVMGYRKEYGGIGGRKLLSRVKELHAAGVKVLLSYHDVREMISARDAVKLVAAMTRYEADMYKVAALASSREDAGELIRATGYLAGKVSAPLVTMAMGRYGAATRIAGGRYGSVMTFAALSSGGSAPGQLPIAQLRQKLDEYYTD